MGAQTSTNWKNYPPREILSDSGEQVADSAGYFKTKQYSGEGNIVADTSGHLKLQQREPFIFYPGATALASGMVLSGSVSGAGTISSGGTANNTQWGTAATYAPLRSGPIDGLATGGIIIGSITIGLRSAAATADAKVTARIKNSSGGTWTTCLALSAVTIGCTVAEIFKTYDIPVLKTDAYFNAVPFDFAIGVQSNEAGTACYARTMSTSFILGEFEPT